jgi:transposase
MHGGKAKHDTLDSQKIAPLRRGALLPHAYVYPAAMRATRDLLRRRPPRMRNRAELVAHVQHTNSQDNLPEIGKKIADKAHRDGVAERFNDPAVPKTIAVDLALITSDDQLLSDLELFLLKTATQHDAQTLSLVHPVPGIGKILSLVWLYDSHDIDRFPRVPDVASSCRLGKWAKESGGKRLGTSGNKIGKAHLTWAFSEAATLFVRGNEPGQKYRARLEQKHDKGKALRMLAHKLARAVYDRLQRHTSFEGEQCLRTSGSSAGEPGAELDTAGISLHRTDVTPIMAASWHAEVRLGPLSLSPARCWAPRSGSCIRRRLTASGGRGLPLPRPWRLPGECRRLSQPFE